jgi:hypothetical protein
MRLQWHLVRLMGMLQSLPGEFMPREVNFLPVMLRGGAMSVRGKVVKFSSSPMWILHMLFRLWKGFNPSRFVMSLFGELVGSIWILQGSLRMPVCRVVFALFIVLGGSAVGLGG